MSRQARIKSETGYLHVIVRGNGRQILFEEKNDYMFFISILKKYSSEVDITVCAYCLMENHVHLLLHDLKSRTPLLMSKLGTAYAVYFNEKYDRCGHLFQNRYLCEIIETEQHLLNAFRYILKNPEKAGICPAQKYRWSSYGLYDLTNSFVDTSPLQKWIGDKKDYEEFMSARETEVCMEYQSLRNDERALEVLCSILKVESGMELMTWNKTKRDDAIMRLKRAGLSIRQIERLTGISRNIVQRVK